MTDEWKDAMHLIDIAATTEHEDVRKAALDMVHKLSKPVLQALADGKTVEPAGPLGVVWGNPFTDVVKRAEQKTHTFDDLKGASKLAQELREAMDRGDYEAEKRLGAEMIARGFHYERQIDGTLKMTAMP